MGSQSPSAAGVRGEDAFGHMNANLTRWSPDDATVFTIDSVGGMRRAAPGAAQQQSDVPPRADWGRFADHFGTAHKAFFITACAMTYDFGHLDRLILHSSTAATNRGTC